MMSAGHFFRVFFLAGQRFAAPAADRTRRVETPISATRSGMIAPERRETLQKQELRQLFATGAAAKRRHAAPQGRAEKRRPGRSKACAAVFHAPARNAPRRPAGTTKRGSVNVPYSPPSRESAALLASSSEIFDSSSPSASSSFSERSWREWNSLSSSDALTPSAYTAGSASSPSTSS